MVRTTRLVLASIMGLTMLAGVPSMAVAQQDDKGKISMDMQSVEIREALRALFKSVNLSYSIAPEVQGTVTLSLKDVPFETALSNVLRQVNATYRITAGVYEIVLREEPKPDPGLDNPLPTRNNDREHRRVRVNSADPMFLAILLGGSTTNFTLDPEISTVIKTGQNGMGGGFGNGFGNGNRSGSGFGNGNNFGGSTSGGNNFGNFGQQGGRSGGPGGGPRGG